MYIDELRNLPEDAQHKAVSLDRIGLVSFAWKLEDALEILDEIKEYVVLGGDLYELRDSTFMPMIENWSYQPTSSPSNITDSVRVVKEYVQKALIWSKGKDVYVDIVVVSPQKAQSYLQ